ncbi:N-acetylmuramic acid 6-phosphate etherase [Paenibacillus apiarius]|uniref:N-acetylmuramic acid 6-phosphate etherase n=1 Tax=Paenibacillus apiarius TaxID=46240 RepID=A0ABT4DLU2_9BACL|nr:N-acetylmuramic acid 6-phosphate etherase [Paenibacillus apiarius]MCY9517731.1 N-acetylmuramic acid 6-phosphate etherase [Paenibacillus apiarius]MCY9518331.1 N-acetylmuramic acid 6-phosphate etherase [Paenibacillus apiarius]MCY9551268.1 N-acetylmuramic acid 6-phosphate etherase [Paenibacillus apiarius]MCY9558422.1 N-acetylmuramic acid 6-phosphate etherase [Paenibacillus apiarius]MCY9687073.1 N-acetylmuramic acid 6-phosphate etherase [Paenibacillus apiarius]
MDTNISALLTEQRNPRTMNIDQMSTRDIVNVIHQEDRSVMEAVYRVLPQVEEAVESVYASLKNKGRLFYVGAGTSGRLGFVDAAECPPTYSTPPEWIQAVIAGGDGAVYAAVEGAEDDEEQGAEDLRQRSLSRSDVVIGIAASGRTPYVIGALNYARSIGAATIALSSNERAAISRAADIAIEALVGPEVVTGSTRMKAATAHKMILNMISTSVMIKLGKVYENLMVDLNASNYKLQERARGIVMTVTGADYKTAEQTLALAEQEVKTAIVMLEAGLDAREARERLVRTGGSVRQAIHLTSSES